MEIRLKKKKKKQAEANTNNCTNLQRMLPCCHCCQISALKGMSSQEKLSLYKFLYSITNLRQQGKKVLQFSCTYAPSNKKCLQWNKDRTFGP